MDLDGLVEKEVVIIMMTLKNDETKREKALVEVADLVRRGQVREIFDDEKIKNIPNNQFIGVLIRCTKKGAMKERK